MIRPTLRAVALFGGGIPVALLTVLIDERLWPIGLTFLGAAILLTGADAILTPSLRAFRRSVHWPTMLYVGDADAMAVDLALPSGRFGARFEAKCDVGELLAPPPDRGGTIGPGEAVRFEFPLVPKRRGQAAIERLWLRWRGPLGLVT